jgi:hypothetical protein
MRRSAAAAVVIVVCWTLIDAVAHRLALQPLYEAVPGFFRPLSEMNGGLVALVTLVLAGVYVTLYSALVRPKSRVAGLCLGAVLGLGFGVAAGFGTYLHSPVPLALAWAWTLLGFLKGVVAGAVVARVVTEPDPASG